jgi:hypothetical protein
MVGPVAGLRLTIALNRRGTLTATTLAVLPKPGRACFITYTSAHPSSSAAVLAAVQPKIDAVVREEPRLRAGQLRLYSYRRFG